VLVATLRPGGLTDRVVALGLDRLIHYVSAFAFEDGLLKQTGMDPQEVQRYFDEVHAFYGALPRSQYPVPAPVAEELTSADGDDRFEFGLAAFVTGLEAMGKAERAHRR
jgi:hypothetical protein